MQPKIFFQCSLPRSGSTLLQNIMGQNPDFYVTPTSGLIELIFGARKNYSEAPEFISNPDKQLLTKSFAAFCNHGIHAYAAAMTDKKYFLDKGRSWGIYYDWISSFLPYEPKIICMVRDLRDIICSMEKLFRKNPDKENGIVNWGTLQNTTLAKRIDFYSTNVPVGIAMDRLESVMQNGTASKMLFIKYEDFCLRPDTEMARIYNFFELPYFQHNYDFISQITIEDDSIYNMSDHTIRNTLDMQQSDAVRILGQPICDWIFQRYNWFYDYFKYNR
jgi:sulfotransferase